MDSDAFPLIWNIHFIFTWGGGLAKWWAHSWTHNLVVSHSWWPLAGFILGLATFKSSVTILYQLAWTFHYKQTFTSNYYFFFYFTSLSGLKTVIGELPPASSSLAANICRRITGRLTNAIAKVSSLNCILYSAFVGSQYCTVALISEHWCVSSTGSFRHPGRSS